MRCRCSYRPFPAIAELDVRSMSDLKKLLVSIMLAACASVVLAGAGSDLMGSFVHESGSDRDAVAISVTVESGADGKFSLSLMAAHPDAHGAAPDGNGEGRIDRDGVLRFTYEDSFFNKGTARFGTPRRATCFPFRLTRSKTLAALCFTGSIPFSVVHKRKLRRSLSRGLLNLWSIRP